MDKQILHLLKQTAQYFDNEQRRAYLVGGSVRNLLLNEPGTDWDIVTDGDVPHLARGLANTLGGYYVHLHDKASRVVIKGAQEIIVDISPLMGKSIEDDLRKRDFTLNAIAAPLDEVVQHFEAWDGVVDLLAHEERGEGKRATQSPGRRATQSPRLRPIKALPTHPHHPRPYGIGGPDANFRAYIIDPLHGAADIKAHVLKAVDSEVFRSDPLRMLRAVRLMMRYQLQMDAGTEGLVIRDAALLPRVAAERIHDELYAILEPDGASERLRFLDAHGLFTVLIPEFIPARGMRQPAPHYWDVLEHSIESVGALERLARGLQGGMGEVEQGAPPTAYTGRFVQERASKGEGHGRHPQGAPLPLPATPASTENQHPANKPPSLRPPTGDHKGPPYRPQPPSPLRTDEGVSKNLPMRDGSVGLPGQGELEEISILLREAEQQGIFQFASLTAPRMKLAALLHDIGKPVTYSIDDAGAIHFYNHPQAGVPLAEQVMRRLSASTQDRRLVQLVTAHHMRPGQLANNGPITPRAIRRFFVDLGPTGIYVALISLADHIATLGPQPLSTSWTQHLATVHLLLTRYIRERKSILPPRLISPEELMRRLQLQPGPLVGQLLEAIAEAQAEGRIHSKEEALWLAEEEIKGT